MTVLDEEHLHIAVAGSTGAEHKTAATYLHSA